MAFDYASMADTADELLTEFGREGRYRRQGKIGKFNPATLGVAGASFVVATVIYADFDLETVEGGRLYKAALGANRVVVGDRVAYVSPQKANGSTIEWNPAPGDTLVVSGDVWTVVNVPYDIAPAGTRVLFAAQIRRTEAAG